MITVVGLVGRGDPGWTFEEGVATRIQPRTVYQSELGTGIAASHR